MCQFKCNLFLVLGLLFGCFSLSVCLYEDQIGKFDWKRNFVGNLKFSHFDSPTSTVKKIFVATHENVVAALGLKSGELLWRQVLEKSDAGRIQFLGLDSNVVTVSGQDPVLVRSWDPSGGFLVSEWMLHSGVLQPEKQEVMWFLTKGQLFRVVINAQSHLDVVSYNINTGSKITSKQIPVSWMKGIAGCKLVSPYLACLVNKDDVALYTINLSSQEAQIQIKAVSALLPEATSLSSLSLEIVIGSVPSVAVVAGNLKRMVVIKNIGPEAVGKHVAAENMLITAALDKDNVLLQAVLKDDWMVLSGSIMETGEDLVELTSRVIYPSTLGAPALKAAVCVARKDRGVGCRVVFSTDDHTVSLLHYPGKVAWTREEGLATITAVEMLDLPLSDADSAIEKEFDHQDSGFIGMFLHRVTSQLLQAVSLLCHVLGVGPPLSPAERSGLVRDEFSLHKMIVVASQAGKLYGINNQNGEIMWQRRLGSETAAFGDGKMLLFVQRSTRHYPYAAQCALLVQHKTTGNGILYVFNPFNGNGIGPADGVIPLGYRVKQTLLLHQPDREFLRSILILDHADQLHVYPPGGSETLAGVAGDTFIFTADPATGWLVGYSLAFTTEQRLVATRIWEVKLTQGSQVITAVVSKNPLEKVHSQGRVLGDRSVLYKYNNPNLVAVVTQGNDPVHKYFLNIYLVDVVSGSVVFSVSHKKAREPIHVVHSENWLVYSYFSEKSRRTELASLELYEGKTQSNTTAFSSLHAPLQPIVDRQAYIMPGVVEAMRETITEKGITSKHILVALANGGVLELPWAFVDPRRPFSVTQEMREEGVIPYMPELPVLTDHIINYNQSIHRVGGIHTAPSGLESTCLVLVYGLDMFYTRAAPSKQFDVLKEDFDHILISAVLVALIVASYATKKLASKKALKQAWK